jgi:4-aminobutyrate aminotransferase-like enzyme
MGNGHPVAGVVATAQVIDDFGRKARYFNTFGGNAVSCAAALAVLQTIEKDGLQANAEKIGAKMRGDLERLAESHACIGAVRGAGLMMGVEIVSGEDRMPDPAATARIVNGLRDRGVLISSCGARHNVLKIRPPLVFTPQNADLFIERLGDVLSAG